MDKYEYNLKVDQIKKLLKKKEYEAAAEIADAIDWRRVKNLNVLYMAEEAYEHTQRYEDCMKILTIAYERAPVGRMLLYKMTDIATRMHNFEDAIQLYREFVRTAPNDGSRYVLKYQIYRERGSSLEDQIKILSEYKTQDYQEQWAYELASLYAQAGMVEECVRECDELILWFSEGNYVVKALELKMRYEPLTAAQQEKYNRSQRAESGVEEPEVVMFQVGEFSTANLQAELAESLGELLRESATIEMPQLEVAGFDSEPEEEGDTKIVLDELSLLWEDGVREQQTEEEEPTEIVLEKLKLPGEEAVCEQPEKAPEEEMAMESDIVLDELDLFEAKTESEAGVGPEAKPELSLMPELEPIAEPEPISGQEQRSELEAEPELMPEPEAKPEPVSEPEPKPAFESDALSDPEADEESEAEKEPICIEDILAEWENIKSETKAILESEAGQAQERKAKVRQETAELMKLISGISDLIPEDVQQILVEIEKENVSEEEPVQETDDFEPEADEEEEEIKVEDLNEAEAAGPVPLKTQKGARALTGNMIQDLGRSLSSEVSEMAVNAGYLTREQAKLFAYFTSVKGISEQLSILFKNASQDQKKNSSSGNLVITGEKGNGKTTLAIDIVRALQKLERVKGKKLAKVSGHMLNKKDIYDVLLKLKSGALIIESAGELSDVSLMALGIAMETDTGGLLIILEDTAEEIEKVFLRNKNFASKFSYTVDIPVFTNDELVVFGKSYAAELEYTLDEFGVLALYDKIGSRQTNDHVVTVAEVKDIIDAAVEHAQKGSVRHLFERMTKKRVDEFGNRLLRESDFT